ncbi:MAG: DUF4386 domain-containing protein, partial [Rhodobacteraceae bacterium]|nr:DUF4386 domain-containing protein [Paracoccaceae bacterium]
GTGMVDALVNDEGALATIFAKRTTLILGVFLMAIVHTLANIGLSVMVLPILKPVNPFLAYGYFAAVIAATITAAVGAFSMLLLAPLSEAHASAATDAAYFDTLAFLLKSGGFFGYQLSMVMWCLGGLVFAYLLFVSRLVPRLFAVWGFLGYVIFMAGSTSEIFGYAVGIIPAIPGGLFEISLSLWLIFKGFTLPKANAA